MLSLWNECSTQGTCAASLQLVFASSYMLGLTLAIHAAWWESTTQYDCRGPVNSNLLSILLTYLLLVPLLCLAQIVYHNLEVWLFPEMAQLLLVLTSSTSSFGDALFRQCSRGIVELSLLTSSLGLGKFKTLMERHVPTFIPGQSVILSF